MYIYIYNIYIYIKYIASIFTSICTNIFTTNLYEHSYEHSGSGNAGRDLVRTERRIAAAQRALRHANFIRKVTRKKMLVKVFVKCVCKNVMRFTK